LAARPRDRLVQLAAERDVIALRCAGASGEDIPDPCANRIIPGSQARAMQGTARPQRTRQTTAQGSCIAAGTRAAQRLT